ncbi:hypothetical protein DPV78_006830 [Talaromyces pinophilus]|nr:hypothetical protein DPV78_006830 [Talaromyces pinophilus]
MSPSRPLNLHLPKSLGHSSGLSAGLLRSHHSDQADSLSGAAHPLDHVVGPGGQFVDDDDSVQDRHGDGVDQRSQAVGAGAGAVAGAVKPSMSVLYLPFTLCE